MELASALRTAVVVLGAGCRLEVPEDLFRDGAPDAPGDGGADARWPSCGDTQVRSGVEQCDDGNLVDGDGCSALCSRCMVGEASAVGANHHCYARLAPARSFDEARADCAARGMELATFQQVGEDQIVADLRMAGGGYNLWIGLTAQEGGTFRWVTGEPLAAANWTPGEPNGGGECARTSDNVTWEDAPCADPHQYVCEDPGWQLGPEAHAYKALTGVTDADQAQAICVGLGAHLVTIGSAEEGAFLADLVAFGAFWTGGRDDGGGWTWRTGEAFVFTAWAPSEPAAVTPPACLVWTPGGWTASACSGPLRPAVCEID